MRVLIVDDYPDSAGILCELVGGVLGHECAAATSGAEALAVAADHLPELIILDIGLPDISGYELAPRLRAAVAPRPVRIAALTGWGTPTDRVRALAAGIDAHFVKPPNLEKLRAILDGTPGEHAPPPRS